MIAVVLAYVVALAAMLFMWLCVRYPRWVRRSAAVLRDGIVAAGRWYTPMESPAKPPDAGTAFTPFASTTGDGNHDHRDDLHGAAEAELVRQLLAGTIARTDYHRAMTVLSLEDEMHPSTPMPPLPDQ